MRTCAARPPRVKGFLGKQRPCHWSFWGELSTAGLSLRDRQTQTTTPTDPTLFLLPTRAPGLYRQSRAVNSSEIATFRDSMYSPMGTP